MRLALPMGRVDPFQMTAEHVKIGDILHCLPQQARFNGYTRKTYSVAQHSVLVSRLAQADHGIKGHISRAALIHDAVETYTGDVVLPLKKRLPEFQTLEGEVEQKVWEAFGLDYGCGHTRGWVHHYDRVACQLELETLLFYSAGDETGHKVPDYYREVARKFLRPMSTRKARRLLRRELATLGFGKTWCPSGPILQRIPGNRLLDAFRYTLAEAA